MLPDNGVLWNLDRIDQRKLPLNRQYTCASPALQLTLQLIAWKCHVRSTLPITCSAACLATECLEVSHAQQIDRLPRCAMSSSHTCCSCFSVLSSWACNINSKQRHTPIWCIPILHPRPQQGAYYVFKFFLQFLFYLHSCGTRCDDVCAGMGAKPLMAQAEALLSMLWTVESAQLIRSSYLPQAVRRGPLLGVHSYRRNYWMFQLCLLWQSLVI